MDRTDDITDKHAVKMYRKLKEKRDFVIKVGRKEFRTQRNILSANSLYFKDMFERGTEESRDGKLKLKDADSECVKSCIDSMYSASIEIPNGKTRLLLQLVIKWQLDEAKRGICDVLCESLNEKNCFETRDIAEVYNLQVVSERCTQYYETNLVSLSVQPQFEKQLLSTLTDTFKSSNLGLTEEEKLSVSLRWVGRFSDRAAGLLELIELIKLEDVPAEYLVDLVDKHPVIKQDFRLYKLINASFMKIARKSLDSKRDRIVFFEETDKLLTSHDPRTGEVTKLHNEKFSHRCSGFSAVPMDSYVYVLCSDRSVHRLNFRDRNSRWERMCDMICDHGNSPPVVSCSGSLFAIGNVGIFTNDVETFTPALNIWRKLEDKPEHIDVPNLLSYNDTIFAIGGCESEDGPELDTLSEFTPSSIYSDWYCLESMNTTRVYCTTVAFDNKIFVIGGEEDVGFSTNDVECYDITSGHWTSLSPTIEDEEFKFAYHTNGDIYVVGGEHGTKIYNVERDEWREARPKAQCHELCSMSNFFLARC